MKIVVLEKIILYNKISWQSSVVVTYPFATPKLESWIPPSLWFYFYCSMVIDSSSYLNLLSSYLFPDFRSIYVFCRKIVLATNIAESSITIDDVVYVIDCGKAKETSYDALNKLACLLPSWISKASAHQVATTNKSGLSS